MERPTNRYLQRAQRYAWEDGVAEIFIGIGGMIYAVLQAVFMVVSVPGNSTVRIVLTVAVSALVLSAGIIIFQKITERVKARTTYPRTGFVELKRPPVEWSARKVLWALVIGPAAGIAGLALVLGLMVFFSFFKVDASLLIMSGLLAASAAAMGWHTGLPRFYVLAGLILLVGISLTVTNTTGPLGINLLFGLSGLLVSLSGGIALARYLHAHPKNEVQP